MHVHVSHPDGEAKFWLFPQVELATQTGLADHVVGEAQQLVIDHLQEIVDAWNKHLPAEISHVSQHGLWVLLDVEELFLPFKQFSWFRNATIDEICAVVRPTGRSPLLGAIRHRLVGAVDP